MKCSWQTFLSPLKGQCPYQAFLGFFKPPVQRVVLIYSTEDSLTAHFLTISAIFSEKSVDIKISSCYNKYAELNFELIYQNLSEI